MNSWTFEQYDRVVDSFLDRHNIDFDSPDTDKRGNLERRLDILLGQGNECRMPVSESLGDGFFQLRAKEDRKQIRIIYFFRQPPHHRTMCFVHAFIKKTREISSNDMAIARKNRNVVEKGRSKINDFNHTC